jgi:hypothetical protein
MGLTESPFAWDTNGRKGTDGMATPGQLVQVMADALGVSRATVFQYDRVLSEHGLRSKHGRGTSAAKVTSRDVANLLTAIGAASPLGLSAKDAAEICEAFSSLTSVGPTEAKSEVAKLGLDSLANLPDRHSFADALSALIECGGKSQFSSLDDGSVYAQFMGPSPSAQIVVGSKLFGIYVHAPKRGRSSRSGRVVGGLVHTSSVGTSVIRALGDLISGARDT